MSSQTLVVDGTNVSWAWPKSRPHMVRSEFGRAQLLLFQALLKSPVRATHQELVLVFDGPPAAGGPSSARGTLVLHPDSGHSADDRILDLIGQRRHSGQAIALASSDRALRDQARALGATTMGAMDLLGLLDSSLSRPQAVPRGRSSRSEKPSPSRDDTAAWLRQFNAQGRSGRPTSGQKEGDSR